MKKQFPAFLTLALIALVAALALALTNALTAGPIEERAQAALRAARQAVLPADTFEEVASDNADIPVHAGKTGDEIIGYTGVAYVNGYAGEIEVILGTDVNGTITGISVGGPNFSETAGLGAKAKDPGFTDQFKDKTLPVALKANIDAIGGATITSQAVVDAVNAAGTAIASAAGFELGEAPVAAPEEEKATAAIGEVPAGTYTGEAQGFQSAVKATVTVGDDGAVTEVAIESAGETEGFGTKLNGNADFAAQFAGQKGPFTLGEGVDAVAGATVTSQAAVDAVNAALASASAPAVPNDGTMSGEHQGFQSTVKATVTVADGLITEVAIESAGETEGFGTKLNGDEAFASQFVGKMGPFTVGEGIDAVAGATVTSKAAVEAINNALAAGPAAAGVSAEGEAQGFQSTVKATVTAENGVVTAVVIDSASETEGFGTRLNGDEAFAAQFVGKTGPFTLGDGIDAVGGATVTSEAAVKAINAAIASLPADEAVEVLSIISESEAGTVAMNSKGQLVISFPEGYAGDINAVFTKASDGEVVAALSFPVKEFVPGEPVVGEAKGFESTVKATVVFNEDRTIASVKLNTQGETEYFGMGVGDSDWANQFVGKTGPFTLGEDGIDAYTRATFTSTAAVNAINSVLPTAPVEETPVTDDNAVVPAAGTELVGEAKGFESKVKATVTLNEDGSVASVVLDTQGETEYFGMKIGPSDWANQFVGKTGPFVIGENGIDVYAGATVTSKAAVEAINSVLPAAPAAEEAAPVEEPADSALVGEAQGFQSKVKATVTLNEDGTIASLVVDSAAETEGFGTKLNGNEEFAAQFIGKSGPFAIGENIDAIAMATVTSTAVVDAVNAVLPAAPVEETPVTDDNAVAPAAGTELVGEAKGFESTVKATVTLNEDGTIASVKLNTQGETEYFGMGVGDSDWANQFVGKTGPFTLGEDGIDAYTRATFTSTAAVNAINSVLPAAPAAEEAAPAAEPAVEEPAVEEVPAEPAVEVEVVSAEIRGFQSYVAVNVGLAADGTVTSLTINADKEFPGKGTLVPADEAFIAQFVGQTAPFVLGENVDTVTGATFTAQAVVDAVNAAIAK